jgi:nitroreductase
LTIASAKLMVGDGAFMDAIEAIRSRTSVRNYQDRELPREVIETIVDCGRLAPSGYNKQPWTFVAVTDRSILERMAGAARYGRFLAQAGACIAIATSESGTRLEDASAAAESMIIAAASLGIGSCWINSVRQEHSSLVESLLRFPPGWELSVLLALGYPAEAERRPKKALSEVLKWNGF